ncbi:MAG: hypothetical protein HY788_20630 [Deltaproteobacteria bacterium]|nr:hypothetical protein [Deltaproteobacteria bacterium]
MNRIALKSPKESVALIAALFTSFSDIGGHTSAYQPAVLSVKEDICFGTSWLQLGEISLKPSPGLNNESEVVLAENAVRYGFYEWKLADYEDLQRQCFSIMGFHAQTDNEAEDRAKDTIRRALHSVIDVAMRLGLLFPQFDADIVEAMPFNRPTTVIADTNAVGKGGVDFLIRFLYPAARLKIPAIVAMEILNQSDNFFSKRRRALTKNVKPKQKPGILFDHVVSQASQRALLRFELHSDIEVERSPLFSDPLRSAFTPDKDKDWNDLNLSAPVKSYCDRLILETARQHLTTVAAGHPVMLMTGDEGLARMTLAEGMHPLFFHAGGSYQKYGTVLTGTRFHPFTGEVFSIPLPWLLWELAVTFGNARLGFEDGSRFFEVRAINQDLNWQPFHAKEDLLQVSWRGFEPNQYGGLEKQPVAILTKADVSAKDRQTSQQPESASKKTTIQEHTRKPPKSRPKLGPFNVHTVYRFDLNVLMDFIPDLLDKGTVPVSCEGTPFQKRGIKRKTISRYLGFLATGGFIIEVGGRIQATDSMHQLWEAMKVRDLPRAFQCLRQVPSLNDFFERLEKERRIEIDPKAPERDRPSPAYVQIAELCGHGLQLPHDGMYGTFSNPTMLEFVDAALKAYEKNLKSDEYILTGLWLETLVVDHGVHPIKARDRLAEAQAAGMLERYTQGSTPDTRFDRHTMTLLNVQDGRPVVAKVCLYHGDFIIPGKASVSIRLVRK